MDSIDSAGYIVGDIDSVFLVAKSISVIYNI